MKTIVFSDGSEYKTTFTVGELITELQKYPTELPVLPAWEGIHTWLDPKRFSLQTIAWRPNPDSDRAYMPPTEILEIDVDKY